MYEKWKILRSIDSGISYTNIVEKFGIVRSTVANMKKDVLNDESIHEEDTSN